MDRRFLDDCGLETHDSLSNELDTIRSEYFGLDLNNSSDSEGPDVTADETSGLSLAGSSTQGNDRVTPVLGQSSTNDDDFITPDTIRSEYFGLDLNNSSDSKGPDVTADETSGLSLAGSSTQGNDRVTPVLGQSSTDDDDFITPVRSLLETGRGCRYGKNQSACIQSFSLEEVAQHRLNCIELSSTELDLVVLGAFQSHMNFSLTNKRQKMNYFFRRVQVCKTTFLYVDLKI